MQAIASAKSNDPAAIGAMAADQSQFITFTIGAEEFGIDIMAVREIKGWKETTTIPNCPPYVRGVINLRGIIVPIFDLGARFGMGLTKTTQMHVVIIVTDGRRTIGLLVDAVSDIITVGADAIRPVPEFDLEIDGRFLDGLATIDDRMVTLVSLDSLFSVRADLSAATSPSAPALPAASLDS